MEQGGYNYGRRPFHAAQAYELLQEASKSIQAAMLEMPTESALFRLNAQVERQLKEHENKRLVEETVQACRDLVPREALELVQKARLRLPGDERLLSLEALGFCGRGEAADFVAGGRIAPGGAFPLNTSGGGLSYCHPGQFGVLLLVEAVRQLRGECGARQVDGARIALAHGTGGILSTHATVLLGVA